MIIINLFIIHGQYGTEQDENTFLVELSWNDKYPNELPTINLNVFYNQHL